MARFHTDGLDDLIADMEAMGESTGELADEMLMAGAEEVKKAWKFSAAMYGHIDTGDMIKSIGYPRAPQRIRDVKRKIDRHIPCRERPKRGKERRKGVRFALWVIIDQRHVLG